MSAQVAAAKGDYTVKRRHTLSYEYAYGILLGMQQAAITWVSSLLVVNGTGYMLDDCGCVSLHCPIQLPTHWIAV